MLRFSAVEFWWSTWLEGRCYPPVSSLIKLTSHEILWEKNCHSVIFHTEAYFEALCSTHCFVSGEIKSETWKRVLWVKRKVKCEDNSSAADIALKYNFLLDTSNIKSKEENLKIGKLWDLSRLWAKTLRSYSKSWHNFKSNFNFLCI